MKIKSEIKITAIYISFGLIWIFLSDIIATVLTDNQIQNFKIQITKGSLFVLLSSILIYFLLKYSNNKLKIAHDNLLINREKFKNLVENLSDVYIVLNEQRKIFYLSPKYLELTGCELEENQEFMPEFLSIINDDDKTGFQEQIEKHLQEKNQFFDYKLRTNNKNNGFTWLWYREYINKSKEKYHYIILLSDITKHKSIEEELENKQYQYKTLFETANDPIFILDNDKIIDCNAKAEKTFETDRKHFLGNSINTLMPEIQPNGKISKTIFDENKKKTNTNETSNYEWVFQTFKGTLFFAEINQNFIYLKNKKLIQVIIRDITKKKQQEKEIQEYSNNLELLVKTRTEEIAQISEELTSTNEHLMNTNQKFQKEIEKRKQIESELMSYKIHLEEILEERTKDLVEKEFQFKMLFENAGVLIYTITTDGMFSMINKKFANLYNVSPFELVGKNLNQVFDNYFVEQIKEKSHLAIQNHKVYEFEQQIIIRNQLYYFTSIVQVIKDLSNNIEALLIISHDITDLKNAENQIRISENRFKNLFEQAADGILVGNLYGEIIDANLSIQMLTGYSKDELLNKKISFLFPIKELEKKPLQFDLLNKGQTVINERLLQKSDGTLLPIEMNTRRTLDGRYQAVIRDVSERKLIQNQIVSTIIETEENERRRFAEDIHDGLGPLLSSIKIYVRMLAENDRPENHEAISNLFEVINEAIQSVKEISNNLNPQILDDFGLISALNSFCNKIKKSHKVIFDVNEESTFAKLEKKHQTVLYRAITELINNTIKHADANLIKIQFHAVKNKLTIEYSDNGKGFIVNEKINPEKTTGFGLFNLQNRIKSIGGYLIISSEPNKGMHVEITMFL